MNKHLESDVVETVRGEAAHKVDREKGVIYHVKIAGKRSANGYDYADGAYKTDLYEGRAVNIGHGSKVGEIRSPLARFGWLQNVVLESGLPFGNLHILNPKTEFAVSLMNAAEQKPDLFGLSHEARVKWNSPKKTVAESVLSVRAVDVVGDGATNTSLFEQRNHTVSTTTVREVLKNIPASTKGRKLLELICEDDTMGAAPMEAPAPGNPDDAVKQGIGTGMHAAVDAFLSGDLDLAGLASKIKDLGKMIEKAAGGSAAPPADAAATDAAAAEGKRQKPSTDPAIADLQEQVKTFQRKDLARMLCDTESVKPSPALLKALVAMGNEADMKELIQEHKSAAKEATETRKTPPKSGLQTSVQESKNEKVPETYDDFIRNVTGRAPVSAKN